MVQSWLHTFTAESPDSIPGQGTKISPQKKKKKKKVKKRKKKQNSSGEKGKEANHENEEQNISNCIRKEPFT